MISNEICTKQNKIKYKTMKRYEKKSQTGKKKSEKWAEFEKSDFCKSLTK